VFLNAATIHFPAVVLGVVAARTLGITRIPPGTLVDLGGQYFSAVGILQPVPLAPQIDEAALVGFPVADVQLGLDGHATGIYLRTQPDQVQAVAMVLPFTANPALPEGVQDSQPSQVLAARAQARSALTGLFLALGGSPWASAGSASPTSWSSPSSNGGPRSACAARSVRPGGKWRRSS
jgi:putative ABC transport system permease protein